MHRRNSVWHPRMEMFAPKTDVNIAKYRIMGGGEGGYIRYLRILRNYLTSLLKNVIFSPFIYYCHVFTYKYLYLYPMKSTLSTTCRPGWGLTDFKNPPKKSATDKRYWIFKDVETTGAKYHIIDWAHSFLESPAVTAKLLFCFSFFFASMQRQVSPSLSVSPSPDLTDIKRWILERKRQRSILTVRIDFKIWQTANGGAAGRQINPGPSQQVVLGQIGCDAVQALHILLK